MLTRNVPGVSTKVMTPAAAGLVRLYPMVPLKPVANRIPKLKAMSLNDVLCDGNREPIEPTRTGAAGFDTLYRSMTLKQVALPFTKHG